MKKLVLFFAFFICIACICLLFKIPNAHTHDSWDEILNGQKRDGWNIVEQQGKTGGYNYYLVLSSASASSMGANWTVDGKMYEKRYKRPKNKEIRIIGFQKNDGDKFCFILERKYSPEK